MELEGVAEGKAGLVLVVSWGGAEREECVFGVVIVVHEGQVMLWVWNIFWGVVCVIKNVGGGVGFGDVGDLVLDWGGLDGGGLIIG